MTYSYQAFCETIRDLDGLDCWLRNLLVERQDQWPHDYSPGLLTCAGELDGHHVGIRKNRLKQQLSPDVVDEALNDPRNGVLVCRRHHDLLERGLVVLRRDELPARVFEFAREWELEGWLSRYFPYVGRAA